MDVVLTGASRGIGLALTQHLAARWPGEGRLFLLARDADALARLADTLSAGTAPGRVVPVPVDLSRLADARRAGERLARELSPRATLVHNAGLWPTERVLVDGLEASFVTNCLGPLVLGEPLLERERLARVLAVSAGLISAGRFDPGRTPSGDDFSSLRTYANTKLAGAITMRDLARRHPELDVLAVHPGVVRTELGRATGLLGRIVEFVKRTWESPETCATRLTRLLDRPRWQTHAGVAPFFFEEEERPWPASVDRDEAAVLGSVAALLAARRATL